MRLKKIELSPLSADAPSTPVAYLQASAVDPVVKDLFNALIDEIRRQVAGGGGGDGGGGGGGEGNGSSWFPSVVDCPAAVPGEFSLANSGVQMKDANGLELLRIWATDPDMLSYNSCNLYIGAGAGKSQPIANASGSGYYNVAIGTLVLQKVGLGSSNSVLGHSAMANTGPNPCSCAAVGANALRMTNASYNSAFGACALCFLRDGRYNDAMGVFALGYLKTGENNVAIGNYSGGGYDFKKDLGKDDPEPLLNPPDDVVTVDSQLVLVGAQTGRAMDAGPSATPILNAIAIGYKALYNRSNIAVIGNDQVTDVYFGSTTGNAKLHGKGDAIVFPDVDPHVPGAAYWVDGVLTRSAG